MPRLDKLGVDVRTLEVLANLPVPITLGEVVLLAERISVHLELVSPCNRARATDAFLLLVCFSTRNSNGKLASG